MKETYPNIQSLLISRGGDLVFGEYFYGFQQQDLWPIQSLTKSFTGALTGIALPHGENKKFRSTICNFLMEEFILPAVKKLPKNNNFRKGCLIIQKYPKHFIKLSIY